MLIPTSFISTDAVKIKEVAYVDISIIFFALALNWNSITNRRYVSITCNIRESHYHQAEQLLKEDRQILILYMYIILTNQISALQVYNGSYLPHEKIYPNCLRKAGTRFHSSRSNVSESYGRAGG